MNPFNRRTMALTSVESDVEKPVIVSMEFDTVSEKTRFEITVPWSVTGWDKINQRYDLGRLFHHQGVDYLIVGWEAQQVPGDFAILVELECIRPTIFLKKFAEPVKAPAGVIPKNVKGERVDIQFGRSVRRLIR